MSAPLVLVTSIPRVIETTLPKRRANATIDQRFGALIRAGGGLTVAADAWSDPASLVARIDGLVINGGTDVDPARYGADALSTTDPPDLRRDRFEFGLVSAAIENDVPVLGVCRGMQLVNVFLGGTLTQHLAPMTELQHYRPDMFDHVVHDVVIADDTHIRRAIGRDRLPVNSIHHQGVDKLGDGLRVSARAPDGTPEAIEDETGRILGIQWHPEFLPEADAADHVGLFAALVDARRVAAEPR